MNSFKELLIRLQVAKILGHQMIATQFNIPTFCEVCNKMMFWNIRDKGLECENCKFSCHKKCSQQIMAACPQAQPEVSYIQVPIIFMGSECLADTSIFVVIIFLPVLK